MPLVYSLNQTAVAVAATAAAAAAMAVYFYSSTEVRAGPTILQELRNPAKKSWFLLKTYFCEPSLF